MSLWRVSDRKAGRCPARSCWYCRAAAHWVPIRPVSIRRCTKPESSRTGSSARRSAPSMQVSLPAMCRKTGCRACRNSGSGSSSVRSGVFRTPFPASTKCCPTGQRWQTAFPVSSDPIRPIGTDSAGYYSTEPLKRTLGELIDFDLVNNCRPRLTVGAAHLRTSEMRYFDSRDCKLGVEHIMASGALPPAFPAVRIDGELYWDGGILSNTPTEAVFDDIPRRDSLIFSVNMWNPSGPEPTTMAEVFNRHKDVLYSNRIASQIAQQQKAHRLRDVITQLAARIPEAERNSAAVRELAGYGCSTRMHVVRLLAPQLDRENHTKDIDFSPARIRQRWNAGYVHTKAILDLSPWIGEFDPLSSVILHEQVEAMPAAAE